MLSGGRSSQEGRSRGAERSAVRRGLRRAANRRSEICARASLRRGPRRDAERSVARLRLGRSRNWEVEQSATRARFFELSLKERRDPRFNPLRRVAIEVTRRSSVGIAYRGDSSAVPSSEPVGCGAICGRRHRVWSNLHSMASGVEESASGGSEVEQSASGPLEHGAIRVRGVSSTGSGRSRAERSAYEAMHRAQSNLCSKSGTEQSVL